MSATSSYSTAIDSALLAAIDTGTRNAELAKVVENLTDVIVEGYNADREASLKNYLGIWKGRIKSSATRVNIKLVNTQDPWRQLFERLGDTEGTTLSDTPPSETASSKRPRTASSLQRAPLEASSEASSLAGSQETKSHQDYVQVDSSRPEMASYNQENRRNMKRHPIQEPDLYWIERSTQAINHLFLKSDTLSFEGHPEAEALHLFWSFCYTLYDNGAVQAKIGERASTSVAIGRNTGREMATSTKRRRKVIGAKLDILFRSATTELGCCEVGRLNVAPVDTKYLEDGFFKMPKTLRDMLVTLYHKKPGALRDLVTVGYLLMGTKIQLVMMDFPHNLYISRVARSTDCDFPMAISGVANSFPALLNLAWKGKAVMTDTFGSLRETVRLPTYSFNKDI